MNLIMVLAVYASISKALGMPLRHPGTQENYHALYQCTDSALLSRALVWMATDSRCANEPFNVTNGDLIRWESLWPKIAFYFGMVRDQKPQFAGGQLPVEFRQARF